MDNSSQLNEIVEHVCCVCAVCVCVHVCCVRVCVFESIGIVYIPNPVCLRCLVHAIVKAYLTSIEIMVHTQDPLTSPDH